MKKTRIIIIITAIVVIIGIIGYIFFLHRITKDFTYDSGKEYIRTYLKENEKDLEKIAKELLKTKSSKKNPYKKIGYASYEKENHLEQASYVQFDIKAQGFLGGQTIGLIYSEDSTIYGEKEFVIYDEKEETGEGNNILIREKIKKNWYYYYNDYDGKVKIEEIR